MDLTTIAHERCEDERGNWLDWALLRYPDGSMEFLETWGIGQAQTGHYTEDVLTQADLHTMLAQDEATIVDEDQLTCGVFRATLSTGDSVLYLPEGP